MTRRRGNNEGCLHQKANGSWKALVTLQGRRLTKTFKTRRAAQDWLKLTVRQIDDGMTYASVKTTLEEYLIDWLTGEKTVMRKSTWDHYQQLIQTYIIPNIGKAILRDLRTERIQKFYTSLVNQKVGVPTIQKIHKLLRSSLGNAAKTGMIVRNPVSYARPPSDPVSEMKILDESQVIHFLVSIIGHRWEALFHLAITTGMRRGELLGLRWDDLDWIKQTIKVERQINGPVKIDVKFQPLKTKFSRRTIVLGEKTIQVLRDHYEREQVKRIAAGKKWVENGLIFTNSRGGPICANHMIKVFQELLEASGLPKIRFHDLRHTAASLMLNNGIPTIVVSRRLGHSKASTTLDVYGHLIESMQNEAAELMDELVTPVKLLPTVPNCSRPPKLQNIMTSRS
jgi:integrase